VECKCNVRFCQFVDANVSKRSNIEKENNWIGLIGLTVDESYWFQVIARDREGNESPSEPKIFALRLRTGERCRYGNDIYHA